MSTNKPPPDGHGVGAFRDRSRLGQQADEDLWTRRPTRINLKAREKNRTVLSGASFVFREEMAASCRRREQGARYACDLWSRAARFFSDA